MERGRSLAERLCAYGRGDMYPFHMPGHKRLKGLLGTDDTFSLLQNPFQIDITEIFGFDNLHHPEGLLRSAMEWTASCYGAARTYYLVNGSSCGLLAAISACTEQRGRILVSRNCHKSVYHGIYLRELRASYVYPQDTGALGIQGGILPEDVENCLEKEPGIEAVLLVSPTYDGIVSDVGRIAEIVHRKGLPLIVDEAHGAHFRYADAFPVSALELGADIVVQSVHKTLPCLTQTALLHIGQSREGLWTAEQRLQREKRIERYLSIYQSSSPSYILMASIGLGIDWMESNRNSAQMEGFLNELAALRGSLQGMKRLSLVDRELAGRFGIFDVDPSKIVVSCSGTGMNGETLGTRLREQYHLELEMCGADYVTAIAAVMDSPEGLRRLEHALREIDGELENTPGWTAREARREQGRTGCIYSRANACAMTIAQAMERASERTRRCELAGRISGEFVYLYPPGIPIIAPGERFCPETVAAIESYLRQGLPVQGPEDASLEWIRTVKEL